MNPSGHLLLVILPALLCACDPCHSWDGLVIDVTRSTQPYADLSNIQQGIDTFVGWTHREQTCLSSVNVRTEFADGARGTYIPCSREIRLHDGAASRVTVHELCHALDHEEGWPSEAGALILGPYTDALIDNPHYPTQAQRLHEVFARLCDDGPDGVALVEALDQACGLGSASAAALYVRDVAFPDSSMSWPGQEQPFSFSSSTTTLEDSAMEALSRSVAAVPGGAGLFVQDTLLTDPKADPAFFHPQVLLVDPESGTIQDRLALEAHGLLYDTNGNASYTATTLVGSSSDPFLVGVSGDSIGQVWRVLSDPLRLEPTQWPDMGELSAPRGYEHQGVLLLQTSYHGPVFRVELESGLVAQVTSADPELYDSEHVMALAADAEGALAVYGSSTGLVLVGIDPSGKWTWFEEIPIPTNRVRSLFRLSDGSAVVTPVVYTGIEEDGMGWSPPVTLWFRPQGGTWSTPEQDCDAIAGEGWLAWGDTPLHVAAVESEGARAGETPSWELQLTRLELSR